VVPRGDFQQELDEPSRVGGFPSAGDAESDSFDGNRLYDGSLLGIGWIDVAEGLDLEAQLVDRADRDSTDIDTFEAILEEDPDEDTQILFGMLDVGVAGAVLGLSAAGCVTSSSCRGFQGHASDLPEVAFWADPERARLVRNVAADVGCSFGVDDQGRASVWGPSVRELMSLARGLYDRRADFEALPPRVLAEDPDEWA
jgi:hypothetical protein